MTSKNTITPVWKLVIAILLCEFTGILSAFVSQTSNNEWFLSLNKPSWNPPSYLFAPVWTFLYLLMGISFWLVWKSKAPEHKKKQACLVFAVQLFLNFWWSILFFRFHSPGIAFIDIVLMIVMILATIFAFARISSAAAWLLVPYISWVCFAAILNYTIWSMNR